MPQRAPSYYHWSMDKPSTTNQVYGFHSKDQHAEDFKGKKDFKGPFDYTRPFSNSGFFPQINYKNRLTSAQRPRTSFPAPGTGSCNRFDINRGYTMGYTPVTEKLVHKDIPVGFKLNRSATVPPPYEQPKAKGKDLYLWHTLSGTLVHCKNYPPQVAVSQ